MTATGTNNLQIVQAVYEAFARGDIQTVLDSMDPSVERRSMEGSLLRRPSWPRSHATEHRHAARHRMEGFKVIPQQSVVDGDMAVMLGEYTGTYKATGKSIRIPVAHALTVREGKLVRYQQYTDTVLFRRAAE